MHVLLTLRKGKGAKRIKFAGNNSGFTDRIVSMCQHSAFFGLDTCTDV